MIDIEYYIPCQKATNRKDLLLYNDLFEEIGKIQYQKKSDIYPISCFINESNNVFQAKVNPLKLKNRYVIYNELNQLLAKVHVGVKTIHSIIESDQYLFVKSAFFKLKYQVYLDRDVIATLDIIRKDNKRFFKIQTKKQDILLVFALFLLAQAIRLKVLLH